MEALDNCPVCPPTLNPALQRIVPLKYVSRTVRPCLRKSEHVYLSGTVHSAGVRGLCDVDVADYHWYACAQKSTQFSRSLCGVNGA